MWHAAHEAHRLIGILGGLVAHGQHACERVIHNQIHVDLTLMTGFDRNAHLDHERRRAEHDTAGADSAVTPPSTRRTSRAVKVMPKRSFVVSVSTRPSSRPADSVSAAAQPRICSSVMRPRLSMASSSIEPVGNRSFSSSMTFSVPRSRLA